VAAPSSAPAPRYRDADGDGRLRSEVFERASPGLIAALAPWLGQLPGTVLEIGAGTGQNAAAFARAFPALAWWPSDPDPLHRRSAQAWAKALRVPERPALNVDAAGDWPTQADVAALGPLSAVVAMNVAHIVPWAVVEGLVAGAGRALAPGGLLVLAGPFKVYGDYIGKGNAAFDLQLQAQSRDWGLRDVADLQALSQAAGMGLASLQTIPADNRVLIFRKTP